ncbi:hypothetical protein [Roseomonas genomospecies 6]|uniref:Uncharacterized protein n=1 Tax=Roseomonas genomospecies 6 TaxID=214106 RepID=A0A9W7KSB4_9PROT|nr:hypothetical protein [Roseomonas genomospecies 6]KAA0677773.1 hypothetical protein DS843_21885 [Roseomonas genomospecies 6]
MVEFGEFWPEPGTLPFVNALHDAHARIILDLDHDDPVPMPGAILPMVNGSFPGAGNTGGGSAGVFQR